jgi:hypothetical protein
VVAVRTGLPGVPVPVTVTSLLPLKSRYFTTMTPIVTELFPLPLMSPARGE